MFNRFRYITAILAMGLGTLHILYGIYAYQALTVDMIWFAGAGFAMILGGHANLDRARLFPSLLMVIYIVIMVTKLPLPQVFFGLALFAGLTIAALMERRIQKI